MKNNTFYKHNLLNEFLTTSISGLPLILMGHLLGVKQGTLTLLLILVLLQTMHMLMAYYPVLILTAGILITFGLYGYSVWLPNSFQALFEGWIDFTHNFSNYQAGYDLLSGRDSLIAFVLLSLLCLILIRLLLQKTKVHFIYFLISLSYLVYGWYLHIDAAYLYIVLHCVFYILYYTYRVFQSAVEEGKTIFYRGRVSLLSRWFLTSSRYLFIILTLALLLPKGNPLLVWTQVEGQLTQTFPYLKDLRQDISQSRVLAQADVFHLSQTGYTDESGVLGGPVTLNHDIAFEVTAPYALYLRGSVLTDYDGKAWNHGKRMRLERDTDKQLVREVAKGEIIQLTLTHKNLSSFTLFTPYQVDRVSINRQGKLWIDINQQITLLGARYKNESYTLSALIPDRSDQAGQSSPAILFNREDYLQLPEMLPTRVAALAKKISQKGQTQYDKALLVTDYLRSHYNYSLTPEPLPLGQDFVDYFLFESPEGYCTYFATSLSILLRTLDIPTRYVEGFRMPDTGEGDTYTVKFSNGHAWVEAYFDGYGWITLEATPAYRPPIHPSNPRFLADNNQVDLYGLEEEMDYYRAMKALDDQASFDDASASTEERPTKMFISRSWSVLPPILIFILVSLLPARGFYLRRKIQLYHHKETSRKTAEHLYHNITELFSHIGYPMLRGETTTEYAHRVKKQFYDAEHDFETITKDFVLVKYGQVKDYEKRINNLEDYFNFAERRVRGKLGWYKYLAIKYIRGTLYTRHNEPSRNRIDGINFLAKINQNKSCSKTE